jgi:hypothetical protein
MPPARPSGSALGVEKDAPSNVQELEGRVTKITYVNPGGRSAFEIYSNYEAALKTAGFDTLWTCAADACGRAMNWQGFNGLWVASNRTEDGKARNRRVDLVEQ